MRRSTAHLGLLGVMSLTLGGLSNATAAVSTVTPDVVAGAQALPDRAYLWSVNPSCTHHVATTGNDANLGTSTAQAWRTVGKATMTLQKGQRACVHAGTYQESGKAAARDGEPTQPITISGAPGEAPPVIIATADDPVFTLGRGYWVIDGLHINKNGTDDNAVRIGGGHHVTVRNMNIRNGRGTAAVITFGGAHDVNLDDNDISEFQRTVGGQRADAHAVAVIRDSTRVLVRRSDLHHNSGDGVQCQGINDDATPSPTPIDSSDITLEDNKMYGNLENGIDIKSCQRVSVRGSVSPDQRGPAADNKLFGHTREGAIVVHFHARNILVENTRMWGSCEGIGVGRQDRQVQNLIVRRNLFFGMLTGSGGCPGRGLRITNARNVDIYDNTFHAIPREALSLNSDNPGPQTSDNIDVWNNIISESGAWIDLYRPTAMTKFGSARNILWNSAGCGAHLRLNFSA